MGMTIEQIRMLEPTEDEVWSRARKDYEGGAAVGEISARYGLARATVYQRAQVWRAAGGEVDLEAPSPKARDLAEIAWRRMAMCVEAGRIQEALCWRSLVQTLEARAAKAEWAEKIKGLSPDAAADALLADCDRVVADERARRASETAAAESLDTPPGVTPSGPEAEPEPSYDAAQVREWRAWAAFSERSALEGADAVRPDEDAAVDWGDGGVDSAGARGP